MTKIFNFLKKQDVQKDAAELSRAEAARELLLQRMDRMMQAQAKAA